MHGDKIDPTHHLVREVSPSRLRRQVQDDGSEIVIGVLPVAFKMKESEDTLSATWREFFEGMPEEQLLSAVRILRKTRNISKNGGFAVGLTGEISAACASRGHQVRMLHEPDGGNDAHASVRRYPRDDLELFELLASDAWSELVMNSDIPE